MTTDEMIIRREGIAGFLTLNRPKAIHALTAGMDAAMQAALLDWADDDGVRAVIVDKDNAPKWVPDSLDHVSDAEIDAIVATSV